MALLMFRTFGVIIVSFIVLIMYVLHRKKNGKFINERLSMKKKKLKYQKWEKSNQCDGSCWVIDSRYIYNCSLLLGYTLFTI